MSLAKLRQTRGGFRSQITRIQGRCRAQGARPHSELNPATLKRDVEALHKAFNSFQQTHDEIMTAVAAALTGDTEEDEAKLMQTMDDVDETLDQYALLLPAPTMYSMLNRLTKELNALDIGDVVNHTARVLRDKTAVFDACKTPECQRAMDHEPELEELATGVQELLYAFQAKVNLANPPPAAVTATTIPSPAAGDGYRSRIEVTMPKTNLPKLFIPIFRGNVLEWQHFWNLFQKNVHENTTLDEQDKLSYLKQHVQDASQIVIIDDSSGAPGMYADYIEELKRKYDCKRDVHRHHTKEIIGMHKCKGSSRDELNKLYAPVYNGIKALKGTKPFDASSLLTSAVESNLPQDIFEDWMRYSDKQETVPDILELLAYIEGRMKYKLSEPESKSKPKPVQQAQFKSNSQPRSNARIKQEYEPV